MACDTSRPSRKTWFLRPSGGQFFRAASSTLRRRRAAPPLLALPKPHSGKLRRCRRARSLNFAPTASMLISRRPARQWPRRVSGTPKLAQRLHQPLTVSANLKRCAQRIRPANCPAPAGDHPFAQQAFVHRLRGRFQIDEQELLVRHVTTQTRRTISK